MKLTRQTISICKHVLWFLVFIIFAVSCGNSELSEPTFAEMTPVASPAQPVEYGASLSEWEEATQADLEQVGNSAEMNAGVVESQEAAMTANATITATGSANATASTEADSADSTKETATSSLFTLNDTVYQEIMWDALIPEGFTADAIMAKYEDELAQLEDGSPEAYLLYTAMQAEFNNAPVNEAIDGTLVRLPGFIAPLEYTDNLITEFLLVPYFGACIHVPPPPVNQTVLVETAEGHGIKPEDSYFPIWIMGRLTAEGVTTELAAAGYYVQDAIIEPYSESP